MPYYPANLLNISKKGFFMNQKAIVLWMSLGLLITTISEAKSLNIQIIMGSTRQGRSSDKVARAIKEITDQRDDVATTLIDLGDYNLPLLYEAISPAYRQKITNPVIQRWADTIIRADAFIIIVPVYNMGYPAVLKNALDLLYKEWEGKPVAFIGYSGALTGGATVIEQLRPVAIELKMIPITASIAIPQLWNKFDANGKLIYPDFKQKVNLIVDQLIAAKK